MVCVCSIPPSRAQHASNGNLSCPVSAVRHAGSGCSPTPHLAEGAINIIQETVTLTLLHKLTCLQGLHVHEVERLVLYDLPGHRGIGKHDHPE